MGSLIELKFCEVSRNSFSNSFWKFQLSILKNKKVLLIKKNLSHCQNQNKKALFTDSIFREGFGLVESFAALKAKLDTAATETFRKSIATATFRQDRGSHRYVFISVQ